jgi:hypothetical protein
MEIIQKKEIEWHTIEWTVGDWRCQRGNSVIPLMKWNGNITSHESVGYRDLLSG